MAGNNPLNYGPDVGVEHFTVSPDYRLINKIDGAGPAPNAVYGPGNWVTVVGAALRDSADSPIADTNYKIAVNVGTRGVNQNLPGLISGNLDVLPFQVTVTNTHSTDVDITFSSLYVDFILSNPAACKLSPFSVVTSLAADNYGATQNLTTPIAGTNAPTSGLSTFPYTTSQKQPYVYALSASDLSSIASKSSINLPISTLGVWRLVIPKQLVGGQGSTYGTIVVAPDYQNTEVPPTTNPPYTVNVNLRGSYHPFPNTSA